MGNLLLGISALIYLFFTASIYGKEAPKGGDAIVGYAWGILLFHLLMLGLFALLSIIIGMKGGFSWLSGSKTTVFLGVTGGLLLAMIGSTLGAFREGSAFSHYAGSTISVLIPPAIIIGFAVLLNAPTATPMLYKIPLGLAAGLGLLACGAGLLANMKQNAENQQRAAEAETEFERRNNQNMINSIDGFDVVESFNNLLLYADGYKDDNVRQHALAKIKSRPDWEDELVRGLQQNWAAEVFTFLASNDVEHKERFAEPIRAGILIQAEQIARKIREAESDHHLYSDQFCWETERVLRTVDKFKNSGVDYLPALQEMRKAFDTPASVQKPKFVCARELDKWMKK
ncbi:MAG: hypothetical protein IT269_05140 [Saprospiraceae bacterium]|nr:hypothetical protein [Saprospiraceae bacterium]